MIRRPDLDDLDRRFQRDSLFVKIDHDDGPQRVRPQRRVREHLRSLEDQRPPTPTTPESPDPALTHTQGENDAE